MFCVYIKRTIESKKASSGVDSMKNFRILKPILTPVKVGGLEELRTDIGTGAVICMATELLPIDQKDRSVLYRCYCCSLCGFIIFCFETSGFLIIRSTFIILASQI